jgi:hypothetical protein
LRTIAALRASRAPARKVSGSGSIAPPSRGAQSSSRIACTFRGPMPGSFARLRMFVRRSSIVWIERRRHARQNDRSTRTRFDHGRLRSAVLCNDTGIALLNELAAISVTSCWCPCGADRVLSTFRWNEDPIRSPTANLYQPVVCSADLGETARGRLQTCGQYIIQRTQAPPP